MTSFSITYPESAVDAEAERDAWTVTFTAGAARTLLDGYTEVLPYDDGEPGEAAETVYAEATWWHSAERGWEVEALTDADQGEFTARCERFVTKNYDDLAALTAELVDRNRTGEEAEWGEDLGWAWYRLGMLFVHDANGAGLGFWDYSYRGGATEAARRLSDAAGRAGEFAAWCYEDADESGDGRAHLS